MVPTNSLRWIWVNDHKEAGVVYVNPPRHMVLQQWWYEQQYPDASEPNRDDELDGVGEWRDVEIVEE